MTEAVPLWSTEVPFPCPADLQLPGGIRHTVIHRGGSDYAFLHESCIVRHGDGFVVAWNNSPGAESERGTVVRWIRANDEFSAWTAPVALAPPLDHDTTIWESAQLLSVRGELWAFVGQVHSQPREPHESGGAMVAFRLDDRRSCWEPVGRAEGFHPLNRPQRVAGGWIMGGQYNLIEPRVALSHGEDLTRWEVVAIPSAAEDQLNFAETSLVAEGEHVTAFVRSEVERVFTSESRDGGRTWGRLAPSNLPMRSSKTCAGMLSTGQRYLALNLCDPALGARDVLAVAVSAPGEALLRKLVLIRRGPSPTPRLAGYCKGSQWSYPSVQEHAELVYVTYSVTKEDCCLSVLPLREFAA